MICHERLHTCPLASCTAPSFPSPLESLLCSEFVYLLVHTRRTRNETAVYVYVCMNVKKYWRPFITMNCCPARF